MPKSQANPADVASIDAIITASYDSISGPPGERDWSRVRSLFIPGARLIPTTARAGDARLGGEIAPHILDVEAFIARSAPYVEQDGFSRRRLRDASNNLGRSL